MPTTKTRDLTVTIDRAELADLIGWVAKTVPAKPKIPALAGLRLHALDGMLSVSAFDGDTSAAGGIGIDGPDFDAMVPGRMLDATLSRMTGPTVTLTLGEHNLTVKAGRSVAKFPLIPTDGYPALPTSVPETLYVEADVLADALTAVASAADTNPMSGKPDLMSIALQVVPGSGLEISATDSYRMARAVLPFYADREPAAVLVPPAPLLDAVRGMAGDLSLGWTEHLFTVGSDTRSVTTRVVAGQPRPFGDYFAKATGHPTVIHVVAAELARVVKAASAFLLDKQPMLITIGPDELEVTGSGQADSEYSDAIEADVTVAGVEDLGTVVRFNPTYLLHALEACGTEVVRIAMNDPTRMIRFDPSEGPGSEPSETLAVLCMPVRMPK